jgi:membrane fusion protein (multidrug efflux system)
MSAAQAQPPAPAPTGAPGVTQRPHKRLVIFLIGGILVAATIAVGLWYYVYSLSHVWTDDAFIDGHIIAISPRVPGKVIKVLIVDNQFVKAGDVLAEIDPRDFEVRVAQARAAVEAAESQRKTAETNVALVKIVATASVDQAKAGVDESKAGVNMAKAGVAVAKSRIAQAAASLDVAKATAERARATADAADADATRTDDDLKRYAELLATNRISKQQMDAATAAAKAAAATHEAARKATDAAKAGIAVAEADVQAAAANLDLYGATLVQAQDKLAEYEAKLADANAAPQRMAVSRTQLEAVTADAARLKAVLDQAELELSYTQVRASEDGYVSRRTVEAGAFFQPGQAMLALVAANVWVTANFKETEVGRIRPGQQVNVTVDTCPGKVFKAHVDSIQAGSGAVFSLLPPENATGNYVKVVQRVPVKIVFDEPADPAYRLSPGMSVIPEVELK